MTFALLIVLATLIAGLLVWGMARPGRVYEYPFLAAGTFGGFILPQLVGLTQDPYLPPGALNKTIGMAILCLGAAAAGYALGPRTARPSDWVFRRGPLEVLAAGQVAVGLLFFSLIWSLPEEQLGSTYSGVAVAYLFLAAMLGYGYTLSALVLFKAPGPRALAVFAVGTAVMLFLVVFAGRRTVLSALFLTVTLAAWFTRRKAVPGWVMLGVVLLGSLAVAAAANYRGAVVARPDERDWGAVTAGLFVDSFREILTEGGLEVRNAVYCLEATDATGEWDYGAFHWNEMVFNYVPAQVVGADVKAALRLPAVDPLGDARRLFGYVHVPGSTWTGLVDCYFFAGYLGCLKFLAAGYVVRALYAAATRGWLVAQAVYISLIPDFLLAITHHTHHFVARAPHLVVFLLVPLYLLHRRRAPGKGAGA